MFRPDRPLDDLLVLRWPKWSHVSLNNPDGKVRWDADLVASFLQRMVNRLMVGWVNGYGLNRRYGYWTRMRIEADAYARTGNKEHLVNVANYAYLESARPEHPRAHYVANAPSITRKKMQARVGPCTHPPGMRFAGAAPSLRRGQYAEFCRCGAMRPLCTTGDWVTLDGVARQQK